VWTKSFGTDFFKNQRRMRKTHLFFFSIQNKPHWHVYRLLRGRTISEKLPKITLFGPSLIHQQWLLESQSFQLLFSSWGTGNDLAEMNLESTGGDKGL